MANGRMLAASIATDPALARLSLAAEAMFLKSIPHLDRDGLITGDPIQLLGLISPFRFSELQERMGEIIGEWVAMGLVVAYDGQNGPALFFPGFLKNQRLTHYSRERASQFAPPPGFVRTDSGLKKATTVGWVEADAKAELVNNEENPGYYPKNPESGPVLMESGPQTETKQQQEQEHQDQHQQQGGAVVVVDVSPEAEAAIQLLEAYEPALAGPEALVQQYDPSLLGRWCIYAQDMSLEQMQALRQGTSGLIVGKAKKGEQPPLNGRQHAVWREAVWRVRVRRGMEPPKDLAYLLDGIEEVDDGEL